MLRFKCFLVCWLDCKNFLNSSRQTRPSPSGMASPISRQMRPPMWSIHSEGPSGNHRPCTIPCLLVMSKNMGLMQTCQGSRPPGLVLDAFNRAGAGLANPMVPDVSQPWATPHGAADQWPGLVMPRLCPSVDASSGRITQRMCTVPLVMQPSPVWDRSWRDVPWEAGWCIQGNLGAYPACWLVSRWGTGMYPVH